MDINGFILLLECGKINSYAGTAASDAKVHEIEDLTWAELQDVLSPYKSWEDIKDERSELFVFLKTVCSYPQHRMHQNCEHTIRFDVFKLRILAVLWCRGSPMEKA